MTKERDLDRTHTTPAAPSVDDDQAPGRSSRSSQLAAPANPLNGGLVQRKARDDNGVADGAEAAISTASSSSGASLPDTIMRKFESSLGADLSSVRVHTGAESASAAEAVGARAYTMGQDIHFGAGRYDPSSQGGQHLLAHEVAHTIQQRGGSPVRQNKLAVSSPADAAEHEADRAADAMLSGQSFAIGGSAIGVHRDADPKAKADETPALVGSHWSVDWVNKQTGADVNNTSTARTGTDAAYGTLKIEPESGGGQPVSIDWVNAASSGAVHVGSMPHAKDKGGQVSTSVRYGRPPSLTSAKVSISAYGDPAAGKPPTAAEMTKKQQQVSTAAVDKLHADLANEGNKDTLRLSLEAAAHAVLGAPPAGYTYDVRVVLAETLDPRGGNPKAPPAVPYAKFPEPGRRKVTITTPSEREKIKGQQAVNVETKAIEEEIKKKDVLNKHKDSHDDNFNSSVETYYVSQFSSAITNAWTDLKQHASHDNKHLEGSFKGHLGTHDKASGSLKDLTIDFGTLAGLLTIENPVVAFALKKALGKGTIGGDLLIEFAGDFGASGAASKDWGNSEYHQELNKYDSKIQSYISNQVKTQVTNMVKNSSSNEHKDETKEETKKGNEKKVVTATSADTVAVKHINNDPFITVTNE